MAQKQNFTATVAKWVRNSEARLDGVHKEATKRTIDIAQTPVAKGGRMRVDTGFLRASGQASLTGMPSGPSRGEKTGKYDFNPNAATATIAGAKLGGKIWFGWTANYARPREAKDAFLRMALQQWPATVNAVVAELKRRITNQ